MTYLEERVRTADYNALWSRAITLPDGSYSLRQSDDGAERDFWKAFMGKRTEYCQDETAKTVMEQVRRIFSEYRTESILELGPGWGNYTLELAKLCKSLTCVDISPDVLAFIKRVTREKGLEHVEGICCKWEDFAAEKKYDAVFGYNCFYRIRDLRDCFQRMNDCAEKLCMAGMGMGMMPPWYADMKKELGCPLIFGKKDMIYFINVLYDMGIDASMKVIPLKKKFVYENAEKLFRGEITRLAADRAWTEARREEILEILRRHFHKNERGAWEYEYAFRGALVYWEPCKK